MSEFTETRSCRLWVREDGIGVAIILPGVNLTIEDVNENKAILYRLTEGNDFSFLVNMKEIRGISKETRNYLMGKEANRGINAIAILVDSSLSRIIGNFFIGMNRGVVPVRLFREEDKAIEWLREMTAILQGECKNL